MARWVDVVWTDLVGRSRIVRATRDAADNGVLEVPLAELASGYADTHVGIETATLRLDPTSERQIPWDPDTSLVMADVLAGDQPSPLCTRSFLRDVAAVAADRGITIRAAVELEFYLVDPASGRPVHSQIDNYGLSQVASEPAISDLRREMRAMGVGIEASNPEYAGGQFEINISHADLLDAADQAVLARMFSGSMAHRHGLMATFMPKPWTELSSSGIHVHQSLWRDGENLVYESEHALSSTGMSYLAGMLGSMQDLALLGSPTPNGFHRRADGSFAPTVIAWSTDNRTTAVRVIYGGPAATRIEHRDGAADCNLYLTMGAQVRAGLDGIERGSDPGPASTGNAYAQDLPQLPRTFVEAYERLRDSELVGGLVPAELIAGYLDALAPEVEASITFSSDWERERYAEVPLR